MMLLAKENKTMKLQMKKLLTILLDKGDKMIVGYILVLVTILETGLVTGESIEYFDDPGHVLNKEFGRKKNSPPGIGYVCIEDYVDMEKLK